MIAKSQNHSLDVADDYAGFAGVMRADLQRQDRECIDFEFDSDPGRASVSSSACFFGISPRLMMRYRHWHRSRLAFRLLLSHQRSRRQRLKAPGAMTS